MPMTTETPSRNRRYPLDEWLDGKRRAIPADQFDVTIESFRSTMRTAARNRGRSVSVTSGTYDGRPMFIIEAFGGDLDQLEDGLEDEEVGADADPSEGAPPTAASAP